MNKFFNHLFSYLDYIADLFSRFIEMIATLALSFFSNFFAIPIISSLFDYFENILDFFLEISFNFINSIVDVCFKISGILYNLSKKIIFYIFYPNSLFIRIFQHSKIKALKSDKKISLSNEFILIKGISQDQLNFLKHFHLLRSLVFKDLPKKKRLIIKNKQIKEIAFLDSYISSTIEIESLKIQVITFKSCKYIEDLKFDLNQDVKLIFQDNKIKKIETKSKKLVEKYPSKFKLIQNSDIVDNLF